MLLLGLMLVNICESQILNGLFSNELGNKMEIRINNNIVFNSNNKDNRIGLPTRSGCINIINNITNTNINTFYFLTRNFDTSTIWRSTQDKHWYPEFYYGSTNSSLIYNLFIYNNSLYGFETNIYKSFIRSILPNTTKYDTVYTLSNYLIPILTVLSLSPNNDSLIVFAATNNNDNKDYVVSLSNNFQLVNVFSINENIINLVVYNNIIYMFIQSETYDGTILATKSTQHNNTIDYKMYFPSMVYISSDYLYLDTLYIVSEDYRANKFIFTINLTKLTFIVKPYNDALFPYLFWLTY